MYRINYLCILFVLLFVIQNCRYRSSSKNKNTNENRHIYKKKNVAAGGGFVSKLLVISRRLQNYIYNNIKKEEQEKKKKTTESKVEKKENLSIQEQIKSILNQKEKKESRYGYLDRIYDVNLIFKKIQESLDIDFLLNKDTLKNFKEIRDTILYLMANKLNANKFFYSSDFLKLERLLKKTEGLIDKFNERSDFSILNDTYNNREIYNNFLEFLRAYPENFKIDQEQKLFKKQIDNIFKKIDKINNQYLKKIICNEIYKKIKNCLSEKCSWYEECCKKLKKFKTLSDFNDSLSDYYQNKINYVEVLEYEKNIKYVDKKIEALCTNKKIEELHEGYIKFKERLDKNKIEIKSLIINNLFSDLNKYYEEKKHIPIIYKKKINFYNINTFSILFTDEEIKTIYNDLNYIYNIIMFATELKICMDLQSKPEDKDFTSKAKMIIQNNISNQEHRSLLYFITSRNFSLKGLKNEFNKYEQENSMINFGNFKSIYTRVNSFIKKDLKDLDKKHPNLSSLLDKVDLEKENKKILETYKTYIKSQNFTEETKKTWNKLNETLKNKIEGLKKDYLFIIKVKFNEVQKIIYGKDVGENFNKFLDVKIDDINKANDLIESIFDFNNIVNDSSEEFKKKCQVYIERLRIYKQCFLFVKYYKKANELKGEKNDVVRKNIYNTAAYIHIPKLNEIGNVLEINELQKAIDEVFGKFKQKTKNEEQKKENLALVTFCDLEDEAIKILKNIKSFTLKYNVGSITKKIASVRRSDLENSKVLGIIKNIEQLNKIFTKQQNLGIKEKIKNKLEKKELMIYIGEIELNNILLRIENVKKEKLLHLLVKNKKSKVPVTEDYDYMVTLDKGILENICKELDNVEYCTKTLQYFILYGKNNFLNKKYKASLEKINENLMTNNLLANFCLHFVKIKKIFKKNSTINIYDFGYILNYDKNGYGLKKDMKLNIDKAYEYYEKFKRFVLRKKDPFSDLLKEDSSSKKINLKTNINDLKSLNDVLKYILFLRGCEKINYLFGFY